jgi:ABC-type multidrug transport system ATPase subunit
MEDIVIVEDLRKTYGKDIVAVDGIFFRVHEGEIFGFLGPNGAGKSTTIKILTTLLEKSSGKATIDNLDIDADQAKVRRIIGYCSQEVGVDDDLTARENLLLQCSFHHIPKDKAERKTEELLKKVRLTEECESDWILPPRLFLTLRSSFWMSPRLVWILRAAKTCGNT